MNLPPWTPIANFNVRHLWECMQCNQMCEQRPNEPTDAHFVYVNPAYVAQNGDPTCKGCDRLMSYVRTEVRSGQYPEANQ